MNTKSAKEAKKVVVVIPFHKERPNAQEALSLSRCARVLSRHPRFLCVPDGMNTDAFTAIDPALKVAQFDPAYFASAVGYNLMCRRAEFYGRFTDYEYLLIHQLDAYVFEDQLEYWCAQGYDYIGAPWPDYEHMRESRKWISRIPFLRCLLQKAGQGGFSLRKVRPMYDACRRFRPLVNITKSIPEDVFWTGIAFHLWPSFRLADLQASLRFSFDASPAVCFDMNGRRLPFGCHGWHVHWDFWKDKIEDETGS